MDIKNVYLLEYFVLQIKHISGTFISTFWLFFKQLLLFRRFWHVRGVHVIVVLVYLQNRTTSRLAVQNQRGGQVCENENENENRETSLKYNNKQKKLQY